MIRFALLLSCLFSMLHGSSAYTIKGRVNLGPEWQAKVYLAAINDLNDYYRTSPDLILNTADVDADGSFVLKADNMPEDERFYRVYLMKRQNTDYDACLYVGGEDHNFVHVLMADGETVEIQASMGSNAPFGDYVINGNKDNRQMQQLASIVFPSFYFYRIKFPTELKLSEDKLHRDLMNYADSCSNPLVALAAINNTDLESYFHRDEDQYRAFSERLLTQIPASIYTQDFERKVRYYADEELESPRWMWWLILLMGIGWGLTALFLIRKNRGKLPAKGLEARSVSLRSTLTNKELEILSLIGKGLSNKEIAAHLFVELSTVKTHINNIYSKTTASNRRDAQMLAKELES